MSLKDHVRRLRKQPDCLQRLKEEAEARKNALSSSKSTTLTCRSLLADARAPSTSHKLTRREDGAALRQALEVDGDQYRRRRVLKDARTGD